MWWPAKAASGRCSNRWTMLDVSPACKALQALNTGGCTSGTRSSATSMRASTICRGVDTVISPWWLAQVAVMR